jgi:hypothetical protein
VRKKKKRKREKRGKEETEAYIAGDELDGGACVPVLRCAAGNGATSGGGGHFITDIHARAFVRLRTRVASP